MNAIELKNVNFSYDGKTQILGNVNLTLSYGEVNLIAGHSGEGKSTLLYIISGIIPNITDGKLAGEVLINGENIQGKRLGEICRSFFGCGNVFCYSHVCHLRRLSFYNRIWT